MTIVDHIETLIAAMSNGAELVQDYCLTNASPIAPADVWYLQKNGMRRTVATSLIRAALMGRRIVPVDDEQRTPKLWKLAL